MPIPTPANVVELSGGQSQCDFFWIRLKSDKTGYDFLDPATVSTSPTFPSSPSVLPSPTRATACAYSLTLLADTNVQPQEDGSVNFTFDNYEDTPDLNDCLMPFAVPESVGTVKPEWKKEDGISRGGAVSGNKLLLAISYGGLETTSDKVKLTASIGNLKATSGSHTQKADDYTKPTFEFDGNLPEANLSIPSAILDSLKVTPSALTLYKENGFYRKFLAKGTGL
ncbi:hypothetical protein EG832_02880 [bacterium]|nr:hypothetical protein [bacterium]